MPLKTQVFPFNKPAFIVTGTHSGCGKTTVTLGLLAALREKGLKVQPFKCGPDFIDPTLHKMVTGRTSHNLDLWMCGMDFACESFQRHSMDADISVIEGVMGMFDGGESSSASLARALNLPVILVLDVHSAAESAAALLKGFETLVKDISPRAVILNKVSSKRHLSLVTEAIKKFCKSEILGFLPSRLSFNIPSRHLGLHTGEEEPISKDAISELAQTISSHINLDRLIQLAKEAAPFPPCLLPQREGWKGATIYPETPKLARIAVARDRAFCFYYEDNLDLLRRAGAELLFFSPLEEKDLPENICGIYLGGGYPELYAAQLSANISMLKAIRNWSENSGALYAECGGFMYLTRGIRDKKGTFHEMVGVFPGESVMKKGRASLGYREIKLLNATILGQAGMCLRGHEFHYSEVAAMPDSITRIYQLNDNKLEGYMIRNTLGSYIHLHFGYTPAAANNFINFCRSSNDH